MQKRDYKSRNYSAYHFFTLHTMKLIGIVVVLLVCIGGAVWGSLDIVPENVTTSSFRPLVCSTVNIIKENVDVLRQENNNDEDTTIKKEVPSSRVVCTSFTGIVPRGIIKKASLHINWKTRASETISETEEKTIQDVTDQSYNSDATEQEAEKEKQGAIEPVQETEIISDIPTATELAPTVDEKETPTSVDQTEKPADTPPVSESNEPISQQGEQMIAGKSSYGGVFVVDDQNKESETLILEEPTQADSDINATPLLFDEQPKENIAPAVESDVQTDETPNTKSDESQVMNEEIIDTPNIDVNKENQEQSIIVPNESDQLLELNQDKKEEDVLEKENMEMAFLYYSFDGKTDIELGPVYEKGGVLDSDFILPLKTFWDMKRLSVSFVISDKALERGMELVVDGIQIDVEYEEFDGDITPGIDMSFYNVVDIKNTDDGREIYTLETAEGKKEMWRADTQTDETQWQKVADEETMNFDIPYQNIDDMLFWVGPDKGSIVVFNFLTNTIISQTIESDIERNNFTINETDYRFFTDEKSLRIETIPTIEKEMIIE